MSSALDEINIMPFYCPSCNKIIRNRRRGSCEYCNQNIPDNLSLSKEQVIKLDDMMAQEKTKHEKFIKTPSDGSSYGGGDIGSFGDLGDI